MSKKKDKKKLRARLIFNPGAGDGRDVTARLAQVTQALADAGFDLKIALVHPKAKATPVARRAVKEGYKLVIAMGGDGTIEAVARGLVGSKTRLGILPNGTQNNIARSLGIPEDLQAACALLKDGQVRKLDVGQIKSKKKDRFYFIELAAVGLTAALYPPAKNLQKGRLGAVRQALSTLVNHPTPQIQLTLEDESKIKVDSLLVTVANTPEFGVNFLVAPQASLEDGALDVCVYPGFSKAELIAYFARIANTREADDGRIQRYRASKVKIKARPKLEAMADGEMLGAGTVKVKVLPGALRVVAGEVDGVAQPAPAAGEALPLPVSTPS